MSNLKYNRRKKEPELGFLAEAIASEFSRPVPFFTSWKRFSPECFWLLFVFSNYKKSNTVYLPSSGRGSVL